MSAAMALGAPPHPETRGLKSVLRAEDEASTVVLALDIELRVWRTVEETKDGVVEIQSLQLQRHIVRDVEDHGRIDLRMCVEVGVAARGSGAVRVACDVGALILPRGT